MKSSKLTRKQLDNQFQQWNKQGLIEPKNGWIKLIRNALGMTSYQLAKRLGVNQSRIIKMESAAADHSITIKTLERAAEALECHLVFALVPKQPLEKIMYNQAEHVAKKHRHLLTVNFCRELHKFMFKNTWKWAGNFRHSNKNKYYVFKKL